MGCLIALVVKLILLAFLIVTFPVWGTLFLAIVGGVISIIGGVLLFVLELIF